MSDVRLDRLLGEEETFADLTIDETVGDELENLDLPRGRILTDLTRRRRGEWDNRPMPARATPRRGRLESAAVVAIPVQDLFTLSGVHVSGIGARTVAL